MHARFILKLVALSFLLLSMGCETTNFVAQYYTDYSKNTPKEILAGRVLPFSGNTSVRHSSDIQKDNYEMVRNNYVLIGESSFTGTNIAVTDEMIREQGTKISADYAIYSSGYMGAEQGSRPVLNYNPGQTSTTYNYGNVYANAYGTGGHASGSATYSGTSTTNTMGTLSVSHVPATFHRYQYNVCFYRKGVPATFGVYYDNLNDELSRKHGRNTGTVVTLVMYNTPAFTANFLPGDIIIAIDDQNVDSAANLSERLGQFAGSKCKMTVMREKDTLVIPVKLNSRGTGVHALQSGKQGGDDATSQSFAKSEDSSVSQKKYINLNPGVKTDESIQESRLKTLKRMRDNNFISEEEFQSKRKKILDEI